VFKEVFAFRVYGSSFADFPRRMPGISTRFSKILDVLNSVLTDCFRWECTGSGTFFWKSGRILRPSNCWKTLRKMVLNSKD